MLNYQLLRKKLIISTSPQTPTKSLIATLAETFYERCGVALADVDYPANKLLFESFLSKLEKGPFLLVKSPYKDLQMLKTKFYFHQDNLQPIDGKYYLYRKGA